MIVRPDGGLSQQGRLFRTFVILASVALAVTIGSRAVAAPSHVAPVTGPHTIDTYAVTEGDTLWDIASALAGPDGSTRAFVDQILALNHMDTATVHVGQLLLVPVVP